MGEQMRPLPHRRLVLFPCPLQGHINPMLQLATILHTQSKGALSIIVVHTHFNSPNPANYPNFTFLPISDGLPPSQPQNSIQDVLLMFPLLNQNCVSPFRDCLVNKILSKKDEPPVSCIISDAWMHFTQSVADELHLPRLVLRTSSVISFVLFAVIPRYREKGYLASKESGLETPLLELPPLRVKDIPRVALHNSGGVYQELTSMINQTKASSGLIWNSFESLEQAAMEILQREFGIQNFAIGPFHKLVPASSSSLLTHDRSCIPWLNTQAPASVLYISFGSIASVDQAKLVEIALGIARSEQPFLWVIRPGSVSSGQTDDHMAEILPPEFNEIMEKHSERGCIVKWAPQQEVLAHPAVGGFWTHTGWNSTLESICEGVPMLCSPSFGDQMVNARYVSEVWKVGYLLENGLEHGDIEKCIRRLMVKENNKERDEMMVRVRDLKEQADFSQKKGGSSIHSLEKLSDYIFSMK